MSLILVNKLVTIGNETLFVDCDSKIENAIIERDYNQVGIFNVFNPYDSKKIYNRKFTIDELDQLVKYLGNITLIRVLDHNTDELTTIFMLSKESIFEGPISIKEWAWEYPREYLLLQVIRRRLMRAYLDPKYKLCRRRLNREFSSM